MMYTVTFLKRRMFSHNWTGVQNWCQNLLHICMNLGSEGEERKKRKRNDGPVQIYSDNLIPELPNTAHSRSRHGLTAAWLKSEWPDNIIPVQRSAILHSLPNIRKIKFS
jgi:hypothetical protein